MRRRVLRPGVDAERLYRAWIPLAVRREVTSEPCAVCRVPYGLKCDHIVPVASGGGAERTNLQSLCHDCNHIKRDRLTNAEVCAVVRSRGLHHFLRAVWKEDTRGMNAFDRLGVERWALANPDRARHAAQLLADFTRGAA